MSEAEVIVMAQQVGQAATAYMACALGGDMGADGLRSPEDAGKLWARFWDAAMDALGGEDECEHEWTPRIEDAKIWCCKCELFQAEDAGLSPGAVPPTPDPVGHWPYCETCELPMPDALEVMPPLERCPVPDCQARLTYPHAHWYHADGEWMKRAPPLISPERRVLPGMGEAEYRKYYSGEPHPDALHPDRYDWTGRP